jgi:hypothetical protein
MYLVDLFSTVAIRMATNCGPLLDDIPFSSHEADFIHELLMKNEKELARSFNFTFSHIDDVFTTKETISISNCELSIYMLIDQQDLHMEYISLSWYDIPELVVPIRMSFESVTVATMTWLAVTEYLCHKWPWICSICRKHNPVLVSFMTNHWVRQKSNMMGAKCGAGTAYASGEPEFTTDFSEVHVARSAVSV